MNSLRLITLVSLIALAACSSGTVKNTLGLSRAAPDEFRVVSRPPLSVPPQFSLRPPSATAEAPGQVPADEAAKALVLGDNPSAGMPVVLHGTSDAMPSKTVAERVFLQNAGVDQADSNVRNALVEERYALQQENEDESWWNIMSTLPPKQEPMVKANAEAQRIKNNEAEGKPVTDGETPETTGRDTGVLGRILGY